MKNNKKTIDSLLNSLQNQDKAILTNEHGTSIQYWCGIGVIGGDDKGGEVTGSQMVDSPIFNDHSDCNQLLQ